LGKVLLEHGSSIRAGKGNWCYMLLLVACCGLVHAKDVPLSESRAISNLTIYTAQGVDSDLLDLPGHLFSGSLDYESSYFTGFGYQHGTATPTWLDAGLALVRLDGVTTAVELVGVRHSGLQDNSEANVAYAIRSPHARLGPLTMRAGFSIGASYAFGTPSYEDAPKNRPDKRYRLQNYNAYELEWGMSRYPALCLVTRIHHRSGMYGLVAPRRVGSNFLTTGIRVQW
jgi:hypothetical protein